MMSLWVVVTLGWLAAAQADEPAPLASDRLLQATGPALADIPNLTVRGYAVDGRSARAVRQSINQNRPAFEEGRAPNDAYTRWSYRTRFRRSADGTCSPGGAEVETAVTMSLPDLTSVDQLNWRDRGDWDRYFAALIAHERNHARIGLEGANRMRAALAEAADCEAMQAAVRRVQQETSAASVEYDRLSDHGRHEGAVFPGPR